jgi:hypothetical protein
MADAPVAKTAFTFIAGDLRYDYEAGVIELCMRMRPIQ